MGFTAVMKKAFPFISAAASLGGPVGTMAAVIVGKALGVDKAPAATESGITDAIAGALGDPVQRAALVQAEQEFQLQMAELGYKDAEQLEATGAADRASARTMQTTTGSVIPAYLATGITIGFFGLLVLLIFRQVPAGDQAVMNIMTGVLGAAFGMVVSFYFGSSAGSDRKTEILAAQSTGVKP